MIPGYNWPCNVYRHECRHLPSQCTASPYRTGYIQQQQSYRPAPSDKYCKCSRPCPIAVRHLSLCSSCVENNHADQYAEPGCHYGFSRQPEAYEPRLMSPKPTTQDCYTYQQMLNQSNYHRNFDRAVLKDPYEAPTSHVSFPQYQQRPIASSSGSVPRTRTTDHLQQFPSQVYVGGLLQESRHEPDDEPIAQAMLSMEFEEHDPGNDTIVKEKSPEAINSSTDIDIHISLHHVFNLNIPSNLDEEMIVGVSNMPDNLKINFATDKKPATVDYTTEIRARKVQGNPEVAKTDKGVNEGEKREFLSNLQKQMTNFEMTDRKSTEAVSADLYAKHQKVTTEIKPGPLKMSPDIPETQVNLIKVSPQTWASASNSTEVVGVELMTSVVREVSVSILQDGNNSIPSRPTNNQRPQSPAHTSPSLPFADNFSTPPPPKSDRNSFEDKPTTPPAKPIRKSENSNSKKASAGSQTYPPLKPSKSSLKKSVPANRTDKIIKPDPKKKSKVPSKHSINRRNTKTHHKNGRKTVQNSPQRYGSVTVVRSSVEVPTVDGSVSIENATSIILPNDPFSVGSPGHYVHHHQSHRNGNKLHSVAGPNPHSNRARGPMWEDKGTSVEYSRKTQTDGIGRSTLKSSGQPTHSGPAHGHSESAPKMTYILCPRCCPQTPPPELMTACWDQHGLHQNQCGPKSSSVPLSPCPNRSHLHDDCSKYAPKASAGVKCSSANSTEAQKQPPQIHSNVSKQCGDYNSIKFCIPSSNGNYEEVEHWILEPQFLNSLTNDPKKDRNVPHQRSKKQKRGNKDLSYDDRCSSEYFVFTPNEFWGLPEKSATNGLQEDRNNLSLFFNNLVHSNKPFEQPKTATKDQKNSGQAVKDTTAGQKEVPFQSPIIEEYARAVMSAVRRQLATCHHDSRKS